MIKPLLSAKDLNIFFKEHGSDCVCFPELDSLHMEADQKITIHAVYVGRENNYTVCVAVDDTDIYLSLINISHYIRSHLCFRQGETKDKDEVNYHDIYAIAVHVGKGICQILSCFHTLTGSDFIDPFLGRSKIKAFKKVLETPKSHKLLLSLLSDQQIIEEVINFVLHIVYKRPYKEKCMGESRYNMLKTKN